MSLVKIFLILSGYQLTWLMCVIGEKFFNEPLIGFITGLIFSISYFIYSKNKYRVLLIIFFIALPGYLFDTIVVYFDVYEFNSILKIGTLPIWMLVLWISFSILFDEVLVFLKNYQLIAILLSAILGPLAYYSGVPLGLIEIYNFYIFIFIMFVFWSFLMFFYLKIITKKIFIQ